MAAAVDIGRPVAWRPNPGPQMRFLACGAFEVLYGGAAGGGKLLRVDEPIATPSGWTTMGQLQPGDVVFGADGKPARVTYCSPVEPRPTAWEFTFDDGTTIESDAEHLWVTLTDAERTAVNRRTEAFRAKRRAARPMRRGGLKSDAFSSALADRNARIAKQARDAGGLLAPPARGSIRSTQQIVDSLWVGSSRRANHCIINAAPIEMPPASLPVDPYVLGAWLGDGTTKAGQITGLDEEVFASVAAAGYRITRYTGSATRGIPGLWKDLRAAGVAGNKHVPTAYLRGSVGQRLALLQGLCDTDGHATSKGSVEFTTTRRELRDGMVELLATLGIKPSVREGRATLRGRDISAKWRIQFWTDQPCFRIARKAVRQKRGGFRGSHDRRYIVAARRVPPTPMRCIAVDSASHTYLAGRSMVPTHNTDAIIIDPLRGVLESPGFACLTLRRTGPELWKSGGLIDRAFQYYPIVGGKDSEGGLVWQWPNGARIEFAAMELEKDRFKYKGTEYAQINFDELTTFAECQYVFMLSRLRSSKGVRTRVRATTNPGDVGHDWVLKRWAPWLYPPGHAEYDGERAEPGQVLWYRHDPATGGKVLCGPSDPKARGRCFIPALVSDNPYLAGTEYEDNLNELDALTRAQHRDGNWMARPEAGMFFSRTWCEFVDSVPANDIVARVRVWDRAATEERPGTDPDWTAGARASMDHRGVFYLEDVRHFRANAGEVVREVRATAELDARLVGGCRQLLKRDPGQAGKTEIAVVYAPLLAGFDYADEREDGDKVSRFKPFSAAAEHGRVKIVRGAWNDRCVRELEGFPVAKHDDQADAIGHAFSYLARCGGGGGSRASDSKSREPRYRQAPGGF